MARVRRTRIPLGFGVGGRQALVSSLLPTASEQAAAQSALRAADSAKVAAFNRQELSFNELKAYFDERLAQTSDATTRTEIQSLIDNAKAADNKRIDNTAVDAANQALKDYQSGRSSYDDALTIINSSTGKITNADTKNQARRLLDDINLTKTQRDTNTKIEDYNKGRLPFDQLQTYLKNLTTGSNDIIKQQAATALEGARAAENAKVMANAAGELNATGDFGKFVTTLTDLRNAGQTNPDETQKIGAALIAGEQQMQAVQDQKTYTAWQEGAISAGDALSYYNNRMANTRDPKTVDALGKYAANLQQAIVENDGQAFKLAGGVSRTAAANRDLANRTTEAAALVKDYKDNEYKELIKQSIETGNPELAILAHQNLADRLTEAVGFGGSNADTFKREALRQPDYAILDAANAVTTHFDMQQKKMMAEAKTATGAEKSAIYHQIIDMSVKAETSPYVDAAPGIDPHFGTQTDNIVNVRIQIAIEAQAAAQKAKDTMDKAQIEAGAYFERAANSLLKMGSNSEAQAIIQAAGGADKNKIISWMQSGNATENINKVLSLTNLGDTTPSGALDQTVANANIKMQDAIKAAQDAKSDYATLLLTGGEAIYPGATHSMSALQQQIDRGEVPNPIDPVALSTLMPGPPAPMGSDQGNWREDRYQPGRAVSDTPPLDISHLAQHPENWSMVATRMQDGRPVTYSKPAQSGFGVPSFLTGLMDGAGNWLQQATTDAQTALDSRNTAAQEPQRQAMVQDLITRASAPNFQVNTPPDQAVQPVAPAPWDIVQPGIISPDAASRNAQLAAAYAPPPPPPPPAWTSSGPGPISFSGTGLDQGVPAEPPGWNTSGNWDTGYAGDTTGVTHGH